MKILDKINLDNTSEIIEYITDPDGTINSTKLTRLLDEINNELTARIERINEVIESIRQITA